MKTSLFTLFVLTSTLCFGQVKKNGFFKNWEIAFSHSFEFDNSTDGDIDSLAQTIYKQLPSSSLGMEDFKYSSKNPIRYNYLFYWMDCFPGMDLVKPGYNTFSFEFAKHLTELDNRLSLSFDLNMRTAGQNYNHLISNTIYFTDLNSYDSLLYHDEEGVLSDTLVLIPTVYNVRFNIPTSRFAVGIGTKFRIAGELDSKWRVFVSANYRRMISNNQTLNAHVFTNNYNGPHDVEYQFEMPTEWQTSSYYIEHLNAFERRTPTVFIKDQKTKVNSVWFGMNIERRLWNERINWGLRMQLGNTTYKYNNTSVVKSQTGRIGGYFSYKL